jgi:hypothetical protein
MNARILQQYRYKLGVICLTIACMTDTGLAANENSATGAITEIQTHSASRNPYNTNSLGWTFIYMDELPISNGAGCGTGQNRVIITSDHPLYNTVVALATAAKLSGGLVTLHYLEECTIVTNAWNFSIMIVH